MTEEKEEKPIYITRGAYTWGSGDTAIESFLNCLKHGPSLRIFKIIKLPDGAKDVKISDFDGAVMWSGTKEKATDVPFDAEFLEDLKDELTDRLNSAHTLMCLLKDLDGGKHRYRVDDLEEITERLYDFRITEMREAG